MKEKFLHRMTEVRQSMRQCMDADNLHRRLKKIIGQLQAIDRMIDEDVPCEDILSQMNNALKSDSVQLPLVNITVIYRCLMPDNVKRLVEGGSLSCPRQLGYI